MLEKSRPLRANLGALLDRVLLSAPVRNDPAEARILRPIAYTAFAILSGMMFFLSAFEDSRFSLTRDFAEIYQAAYMIGHGVLDPINTIARIPQFWRGHLELYPWLVAPLGWLFPEVVWLKWFQDAMGIIACIVAWRWMLTILYGGERVVPYRRTLAICSLFVLVVEPWIYWAYAFDVHSEPVAVAFLVACAFAFYRGRTALGFWLAGGVLLEGDVVATYLVGLGATLLLTRWRKPWIGIALAVIGVFWLQFAHLLGAGVESAFRATYGYLVYDFAPGRLVVMSDMTVRDLIAGLAAHPADIWLALYKKKLDIYANLAPLGFVGIFAPWSIGVSLLVLVENELAYALAYAQPNFQTVPVYVFGTIGLTWLLWRLALTRLRGLAPVIAVLACVNAVGWAVVWIPQLYPHWVRVSPATALELARVRASFPSDDQVATSQGVIGEFAGRKDATLLYSGIRSGAPREPTQFVVVPYEGVNVETVNELLAILDTLVSKYHADVRSHNRDVWWLTAFGPPSRKFLLPTSAENVPGWACSGQAGMPDLHEASPSDWNTYDQGARGYVVARAYWREPAGNYRAGVEISSSGPVSLEVWDQTLNTTISREVIPPGPRRRVYTDFRNLDLSVPYVFRGWGPFTIEPNEPPVHDNLEVRLFSPGRAVVRVFRVFLAPLKDTA